LPLGGFHKVKKLLFPKVTTPDPETARIPGIPCS